MNIDYPRWNSTRSVTIRRIADRRHIAFPFDSLAWIENISKHYLAWPKNDRREANRRHDERRVFSQYPPAFTEKSRSEPKYSHILLTREERKMIQDLYLHEAD